MSDVLRMAVPCGRVGNVLVRDIPCSAGDLDIIGSRVGGRKEEVWIDKSRDHLPTATGDGLGAWEKKGRREMGPSPARYSRISMVCVNFRIILSTLVVFWAGSLFYPSFPSCSVLG